jgi:hypothetical protein
MSRIPKGSILRPPGRRAPLAAGLQRRLRAREEVPASGQIVFRAASQVLR